MDISTGSIKERAEQMHAFLSEKLPKGVGINFVAHSMGGLDCRHLISTIRPTNYTPLSLTTIGTPHRGSPFMDWCAANIGVGTATAAVATATASAALAAKGLPFSLKSPLLALRDTGRQARESSSVSGFASSFTRYLLNIFDSPAYSNLTTSYLRDQFNPVTLDDPNVKYTSVAGRLPKMSVLHPLWFPKLVIDATAEKGFAEDEGHTGKAYEGNDGLVSVSSAKWGEFLGTVDECHHWDLRGEGGIFPSGGTTSNKPEGRPDTSKPGGWDWEGELTHQLGLQGGDAGLSTKNPEAAKSNGQEAGVSSSGSSSWDVAQVGQVLDWVTGQLPGGKNSETGKRQLADAQREKEKEERRQSGAGGMKRERSEGEDGEKRKRDKFDLARFYGGLMVKLREDGF